MAMKVPAESKKIEEVKFESADGGMSTDKAWGIASMVVGNVIVIAGSAFIAKIAAGNGQQSNNPPEAQAPQDLNAGFIADRPLSF